MPLGNFLYELESCSRYVTHRPNSGLSNGTKIITLGSLEKIGHAYFKKRHPQTPFASYFSTVAVFAQKLQLQRIAIAVTVFAQKVQLQ